MANTKITSRVIADNSVGIDALNVTDGTNGQYLQTDGAGTLSFSTVSGYTDSDVETYLDGGTSTPILASLTVGSNYPLKFYEDAGLNLGITQDTPFASINNGGYNTSLFAPLANLTDGYSNAAFGTSVLSALTSGSNNTFFGNFSAQNITTASNNTGIGTYTLVANTADNNTAVGYYALNVNTTGVENVAVGSQALASNTTASQNTAVGYYALQANTEGVENVAIGWAALDACTTGIENTAVGTSALSASTTASENTAVGRMALRVNTSGTRNTGLGHQTLIANTTGNDNTAVGKNALGANTTGYENTAVGSLALDANTTGVHNTAIGREAMGANTGGYENTCVGNQAGAAITTGYHNVIIGHRTSFEANGVTTGIDNTLVGAFARTSSGTVSSETVIGRYALGQGTGTGTLGLNGNGVHIALNGSTTSWSSHSDERLKENIVDSTAGLSFINDLRPITYNWKSKKDISADFVNYYDADSDEPVQGQVKQTNHGFIAQEIKAAIDAHPEIKEGHSIWRESPDGVQNVADGALMPMMVKAVQELSTQVDQLKSELLALKGE